MSKPFLTYDQQLDKLLYEKKLLINDRTAAKELLRSIGYFSLIGGYKAPFINPMTRIYQNNASFEDIYALYQFDLLLRELVFKYLCIIECKIRQLISYHFCNLHGEQQAAYLSSENFNLTKRNAADISRLIKILSYQANKNPHHNYVVHQRQLYHNVPLWVLINTLSYGQLSMFYTLLPFKLQSNISKNFLGINERHLECYLKILTLFRNVCAHNERLYSFRIHIDFPDTSLHKKLKIPKMHGHYKYGKRDLFGLVIAFRYLLSNNDFLEFKRSLNKLMKKHIESSTQITENSLLKMMGFPNNWKNITRFSI